LTKFLPNTKFLVYTLFSLFISFTHAALIIVKPNAVNNFFNIYEALEIANEGDVIRLTAGKFNIEKVLVIKKDNLRLEGAGRKATILSIDHSKFPPLVNQSNNLIVQDLSMQLDEEELSKFSKRTFKNISFKRFTLEKRPLRARKRYVNW
tara:strand:+ start:172 stop:621 length:450 start_codon:yes stop_codon:yes gene_type:complete